MKWLYLQEIWRYFGQNKKRTAIAIAGIALGVFTLVLMSGLSGAMRQKTLQDLGAFGSRLIVVAPGELILFGHKSASIGNVHTLSLQDARAIEEKIDGVEGVAALKNGMFQVATPKRAEVRTIMGIQPSFFELLDFDFACGGSFGDGLAKRAVIGAQSQKDFFDSSCVVGKTLLIANIPFVVKGVLKPRGNVGMEEYDSTIFVPLSIMQRLLGRSDWLDGIFVLSKSSDQNKKLIRQIVELLKTRHGKKDFTVMDYEAASGTSAKMQKLFFILSIIVATIAYGVGVLGIVAIMALSVYERVIEIAIKRVVGATKRELFWQFFGESLLLSLFGALLGALAALGLLLLIERLAHWPLYIPFSMIALATWLSILFGMVASIYPSTKAAKFEPVKILRLYEES